MATVLPNTKDGKTTSYKFRAFLGKDEAGKQVTRYTTWYVPEDMKPNRAQRAAEKAAELWEQAVKEEYKKDLQTPEVTLIFTDKKATGKRRSSAAFTIGIWTAAPWDRSSGSWRRTVFPPHRV